MIPLMIDLSGRSVVIFGGGDVGARKAAFFCHEADVTVISRSFSPLFDNLTVRQSVADIDRMNDEELRHAVSGAFLVVSATSDASLNNRIGERCREEGILFNNAEGAEGPVMIPSVIRGEHYLLAVSTGGQSPAVSRYIRELIETACPDLDAMIALQSRLRIELKKEVADQKTRSEILHEVIHDPGIWQALAVNPETAWNMVAGRYLHG
jgi:precorrin-2 dehydrogenase/sirohydrochlorin ferrochelatase